MIAKVARVSLIVVGLVVAAIILINLGDLIGSNL